MRGSILPAALLGTGAGLYFHALFRLLQASLWPGTAAAHFLLILLGAPVAAAAVYLFCAELKEEGGGRKGWPWMGWGVSSLAVLFLVERGLPPGMGADGVFLPLPLLVLCGMPAFAAAAALLAGCEEADPLETGGVFTLFLGAGVLAASLGSCLHPRSLAVAGAVLGTLPAPLIGRRRRVATGLGAALVILAAGWFWASSLTWEGGEEAVRGGGGGRGPDVSWCGSERLEKETGSGGDPLLKVGDGLRGSIVRPSGAALPFVPLPGTPDGSLDILAVGYPAADWLAFFHGLRGRGEGVTLTVLEPSRALPRLAEEVWPENVEAAEAGDLKVITGNPRWFLGQSRERFDLILYGAAPSPTAYLRGALAFRENHLYTVEAFKDAVRHLEPGGIIHFRRPGTGRVVSTLRQAAGGQGEFSQQVVVLGDWGRLVSECYFKPRGFSAADLAAVNDHSRESGAAILYSPETRRRWNLYFDLARGERTESYYFTSPQDLSPATDRRPFFEHFQRLAISPHGSPMPEERGRLSSDWTVRFFPSGDRVWWQVILWSLVLAPFAVGVPAVLHHHRTGLAGHLSASLAPLFWLGLAAGTVLQAAAAFARWMDPLPGREGWAQALFLVAAGAGWLASSSGSRKWRRGALTLAAVSGTVGLAGYSLSGAARAAGPAVWGLALVALLFAAGTAAGASSGSCLRTSVQVFPGSAALIVAPYLLAVVAALAGGKLMAVFFGFPLLWLLAGAYGLFSIRSGREL